MIPTRSVDHRALEIVHTWQFDIARERHRSNRGEEDRCMSGEFNPSLSVLEPDFPLVELAPPFCAYALHRWLYVFADIILVDPIFHIYTTVSNSVGIGIPTLNLYCNISGCSQSCFDQFGFRLKPKE